MGASKISPQKNDTNLDYTQNLNKDTEQARLEEEMRKRRERIELVSKYCLSCLPIQLSKILHQIDSS